jgi:LysR family transcriptional regulator for metE and metH
MLDLLRKVLVPVGINPPRRHSELTIAIIQLVASRRGIAALPYWTVMPYLEKGYVVARQIGEPPLQSELYAAMRVDDGNKSYLDNFCQIVRERGFADLPGLSPLGLPAL